MIAIGRYVVFTIFVTTATILSAHEIYDDKELKEFLFKIKKLHDQHRLTHSAQTLELDDDLSKTANTILNNLNNNETNIESEKIGLIIDHAVLEHNSKLDKKEAARLFAEWYDTGAGYDYENEPSEEMKKKAAPFTQIVWASTKMIGLAMSVDFDSYDIVVVYSPPGNIQNQYENNVFSPKQ